MIDNKIIEACKNKDQGAFKLLYNSTLPYMIFICRRYMIPEKHLEDLLQEIYSEVFVSLEKYQLELGPFKPWFRKVGIYTILKSLRKNKIKFSELEHATINSQLMVMPTNALEEKELLHLINKLPEGYKTVFNHAIIDGLSHKEIAALLGISASTSRSQLSRAKEILKKQILNLNKINTYGAIGH